MTIIEKNIIDALRDGEIQAIGHCANCQSTMNSGVAKALRDTWPIIYEADQLKTLDCIKTNKQKLGSISMACVDNAKYVFNLYGQDQYGYDGSRYVNYEAIYSALEIAKREAFLCGVRKIGFPYKMASDRAGGNWAIISTMIEVVFSNSVESIIYKLPEKG